MAHLTITWTDTSSSGLGLADDILHGAVYNATQDEVIAIPPTIARSVETQVITLPVGWVKTDTMHLYTSFRRADGLDCSDTGYTAVVQGS
jgi:hypothetical protein